MTSPQLSRVDPNELQSRGVTPFIVTHLRALSPTSCVSAANALVLALNSSAVLCCLQMQRELYQSGRVMLVRTLVESNGCDKSDTDDSEQCLRCD